MSAGEDSIVYTPLCQGFLKKRKDKIRLRWVTYWFKLHNSTLLFYNSKHGNIADLRGQYYLIEIESVHEVTWTKKKHYIFEIALKNGKRKVLAAETADLRQHWMCQLLQAMNHHVYKTTEPNSNWKNAPYHMCSTSQLDVSNELVRRQHSEPDSHLYSPSMHSAAVIPSTTTLHIYTDLDVSCVEISQCTEDEVKDDVTDLENAYDVLPLYKPLHSEESIYDTPRSNRRASEREYETTESIYDIPTYAFREKSANESSCAKERPELTGLLQDMVACLGGNATEWVRTTAPGAICQP
ncbi:uncharacterized protein LOC132900735 [Neoarius graeffei]|uniref:uncharacterized protein LOC132900735 n=1 Tax=Neoarius graeffei TaxID=443677 RepID=UPI00298BE0BE|nr:uncharacterized protein LOC132900735 [Neoarius graeffei]